MRARRCQAPRSRRAGHGCGSLSQRTTRGTGWAGAPGRARGANCQTRGEACGLLVAAPTHRNARHPLRLVTSQCLFSTYQSQKDIVSGQSGTASKKQPRTIPSPPALSASPLKFLIVRKPQLQAIEQAGPPAPSKRYNRNFASFTRTGSPGAFPPQVVWAGELHPRPNPKPDVQVSKHPAFQMFLDITLHGFSPRDRSDKGSECCQGC